MKALAVASGIVFWTLVLGAVILIFFPSGSEDEPIAVLQIEAAPPSSAPAAPVTTDGVDLPPGFSVTGPAVRQVPPHPLAPMQASPGQGTPIAPMVPPQAPGQGIPTAPTPPPSPPSGPSGALETPERQGAVVPGPGGETTVAAADLAPGIDLSGGTKLGAVPAPGLVEESDYGPLPKIAADGRRPADTYARPSRYGSVAGGPPRVAVLVNGLGVPGAPDADVIKGLPPPVSIAYGAYGRGVQELVTQARDNGHEVLLAIPLEPNNYPAVDPGPHTLLTTLPKDENIKRLQWLMSRYTGYVGLTNHMGSKFMTNQSALQPVLEETKRRGLIYLDDGSVNGSATGEVARGLDLEYSVAQVQLEPSKMDTSLAALEAEAKAQGAAIGVAKAEPSAVKRIAEWAGSLEDKGLVLVPVSVVMRARRQS
jgi:polysaccharide deacetylase 2 family uncharacterized protein YibQ